MLNIQIKNTTADDIPALSTIVDQTGLFPSEMLPDMLRPYLDNISGSLWFTAFQDGQPVGLCYSTSEALTNGTWNMLAIAVDPGLQGLGIGAALVEQLENELIIFGVRILIVDTSGSSEFDLTRQFYLKNGYDQEARIRDFWDAGDDKVVFRKALQ